MFKTKHLFWLTLFVALFFGLGGGPRYYAYGDSQNRVIRNVVGEGLVFTWRIWIRSDGGWYIAASSHSN